MGDVGMEVYLASLRRRSCVYEFCSRLSRAAHGWPRAREWDRAMETVGPCCLEAHVLVALREGPEPPNGVRWKVAALGGDTETLGGDTETPGGDTETLGGNIETQRKDRRAPEEMDEVRKYSQHVCLREASGVVGSGGSWHPSGLSWSLDSSLSPMGSALGSSLVGYSAAIRLLV